MSYLSYTFDGLRDMAAREPYGSLPEQLQDALSDELDALDAEYTKEVEDIAEALENMECTLYDVRSERDHMQDERDAALDEIEDIKEKFNAAWTARQEYMT